MAFRVGQKVICVDASTTDAELRNWTGKTIPKKGEIYTVRGWVESYYQDHPGIVLEEIRHEISEFGSEPNFRPRRFRAVVSTDTGMAILEQIRRDVSNKILRPIFEDEQV